MRSFAYYARLHSVTTEAKRLGRAIAARRGQLGVSQEGLGKLMGGVGASTVVRLEQGRGYKGPPRAVVLAAIDRALGWQPGSALACFETGATPLVEGSDEAAKQEAVQVFLGDQTVTESEARVIEEVARAALRAVRDR